VLANLGVGFALVFWFLFRNSPREHPWANDAEQREVSEFDPPIKAGQPPVLRRDPRSLVNFGFVLLYAFASTFADNLYVFWIPLFLREAKGLGDIEMGLFGSLPLWGGALGGLCGGLLNDVLIRATGRRRLSRSGVGFTGKLLAAVLISLSVAVSDGRLVMLVLLGCKFFSDWSQPTVWGTITDISGRAAGTIFGIVNSTGTLAAFIAGPVMGGIKQSHGWDVLFFTVAGVYVVAALTWLVIDCTRPLVVEPSEMGT
jgi:nitrate/nitrite transporter NarK